MKKNVASSSLDRFRSLPDFPAFEAFSHALWNDEAAAMVGAGFSRACNREKNSPTPPLWSDFKKQMAIALGSDHTDGLDASGNFMSAAGTLFPMALCGLSSL